MIPTPVFDTYWWFATERQAIFHRRLTDPVGPWTSDPILRFYRFTNAYRAADRVSQYLIGEVQYRSDRPQSAREIVFRTLLFKVFNRIETWQAIEQALGPVTWECIDLDKLAVVLGNLYKRGKRIYSAAYIMPSPPFGHSRKHENHIALLACLMSDGIADRISKARSLRAVYEMLLQYPGIGPFLALQYTIDLNYSELLHFNEADFVVAGPGALDGIAKCFANVGRGAAEDVIYWMTDCQEKEFLRLGLEFKNLFGRRLQPIDCQNLFCEISKYTRVSHPEVVGRSVRRRIKQTFQRDSWPLPVPRFPPRWRLQVPDALLSKLSESGAVQGTLF